MKNNGYKIFKTTCAINIFYLLSNIFCSCLLKANFYLQCNIFFPGWKRTAVKNTKLLSFFETKFVLFLFFFFFTYTKVMFILRILQKSEKYLTNLCFLKWKCLLNVIPFLWKKFIHSNYFQNTKMNFFKY